jgi:multiple antibiotic resistance protein
MTGGLPPVRRRKLVDGSVLTAGAVGLLFIPLGPLVLSALGLKSGDFQIAGGLLVLVIALRDVVGDRKMIAAKTSSDVGVVPIGIPLLVGPAVFATLILLQTKFSWIEIALSLLTNLFLAWIVFRQSSRLIGWMGLTGTKVVSKLAALLLTAYAVMMIRVGFSSFIK